MAAQNKLFQRLIWLADTIYSAKRITLEEIDSKWSKSSYSDGESHYGARNLSRHKETIMELFGIEIKCDRATNEYYIANEVSGKSSTGVRGWIINTFALNNLTNISTDMQDRVLFEEIPKGGRYLTTIVNAMKKNRQLHVTYKKFQSAAPSTFLLAPYCLKVFKQRWYLVGKPDNHPDETEPRVYALDRITVLTETSEPFKMPKKFNPQDYFANYYGVFCGSQFKPEHIRVRVGVNSAPYLRSLALHASQTEPEPGVFEWFVAPTFDFIQQLRTYGSDLEVLAPQSLRDQFAEEAITLQKMYK